MAVRINIILRLFVVFLVLRLISGYCTNNSLGMKNGNITTGSISASSGTPANNVRLDYSSSSSWCVTGSEINPYLQINLEIPHIICAVATQGNTQDNQWVMTYEISLSNNGITFTTYTEKGEKKTFYGNVNRNGVMKNVLRELHTATFVRFLPKTHHVKSCLRVEVYGMRVQPACTSSATGISNPSVIPDFRFLSSSLINNDRGAATGRLLNQNNSWVPRDSDTDPWLQVDLGATYMTCAVATQGSSGTDQWTKTYRLQTSIDNKNWVSVEGDKEFSGNRDRSSIVTNTLAAPALARFVRFYPMQFQGKRALRVEVYGTEQECSRSTVSGDEQSLSDMLVGSSESDSGHTVLHSRLYGNRSWCSGTSTTNEYIQYYLEETKTVTGIATQGDPHTDQWVTSYSISYAIDGDTWFDYQPTSSTKIIAGNSDRSTVVIHWLDPVITAIFVRIIPQSWTTAICLRAELFGCEYTDTPIPQPIAPKHLPSITGAFADLECYVYGNAMATNIEWSSDGTYITSNASGVSVPSSGLAISTLRVNYTSMADTFSRFTCHSIALGSPEVQCRSPDYTCVAYYKDIEAPVVSSSVGNVLVTYPILYTKSTTMDEGRFTVWWAHFKQTDRMFFKLEAEALGWIGFGFTLPDSSYEWIRNRMDKYDVLVGGVYSSNGTAYGMDYLTCGHNRVQYPSCADSTNDWNITNASEIGGKTTLEFNRKRRTDDLMNLQSSPVKGDIDVTGGLRYFVWAYHRTLDTPYLESLFAIHYRSGIQPVMLLQDGEFNGTDTTDSATNITRNETSVIAAADTIYTSLVVNSLLWMVALLW